MNQVKEEKDKLQTKKINKLTKEEALTVKSILENCDQKNSRKYKHIIAKINEFSNE